MLKRLGLIVTFLGIILQNDVCAMPREAEHELCLKKAVTDAEVTKCREIEIAAVKKQLIEDEMHVTKEKLLQRLVKSKDKNIEVMHKYFHDYAESYCLYYVIAYRGNGYSDAYNRARCELANLLQYEDDITSIFETAGYDIKV